MMSKQSLSFQDLSFKTIDFGPKVHSNMQIIKEVLFSYKIISNGV